MKQEDLAKELQNLGDAFNLLLIVPAEKLQQNINQALGFLTKENGLYISLNKPYVSIKDELKKQGIKTDNIFFIDCITDSVSEPKKQENVLFIQSPSDLTGLSLAVGKLIKSAKSENFLLIDSLRTLLIYNEANTVSSFVRTVAEESANSKFKTVIFTTKDGELFKKISPFFDKCLEVD